MFWSIFTQCTVLIGAVVLIGGIIGWITKAQDDLS
jgi:hypothetical protein